MRSPAALITLGSMAAGTVGRLLLAAEPSDMATSNAVANWVTAAVTAVCAILLKRLLNQFDSHATELRRFGKHLSFVDRDVKTIAKEQNITLLDRDWNE